jgi:hypothetical protein
MENNTMTPNMKTDQQLTIEKAIEELWKMQSQIVHGTTFFGKTAQLIEQMRELLRSAHAIADRKGEGTHWERFASSIAALGIGPVTARTYRILPSDTEQPIEPKP